MPRDRESARLTLLGVGAMNSPRFAPAGLLVECGGRRVMLDGGPGAEPRGRLDAWLVTDRRAELIHEMRLLARALGVEPRVGSYVAAGLRIEPLPVVHTSHPTFGYRLGFHGTKVVWAPEFLVFPTWARRARLMFAEAAGYRRSILFAHGTGGHASLLEVATAAEKNCVGTLVFAHLGRPTLRAMDEGLQPPFGMLGRDGDVFTLQRSSRSIVWTLHRRVRPRREEPAVQAGSIL